VKYRISKSFAKKFRKNRNKQLAISILAVMEDVSKANVIDDISNIKKLKGTEHSYRIRIGKYRIGVVVDNDIVDFVYFDHRKDIYKYFP